ncbi:MAG TPA: SRPBCC family protein [Frankiaceae bacterium]|jgi:hypothetical protein|nr:SRPBCC family protein [Frankiaceae bacterium]
MTTVVSRVGESGPRPEPLAANDPLFAALTLTESAEVDAPAEAAYALVADVTRIGELSPECVKAEWVGEGVFEGTNRVAYGDDEYLWVRPCTVVADEPGRRWAYVVGDRFDGTPATRWEYAFEDVGGGRTRVTQTFTHLPDGLSGLRSQADADPANAAVVAARTEALRDGMRATLAAMRAVLQSSSA